MDIVILSELLLAARLVDLKQSRSNMLWNDKKNSFSFRVLMVTLCTSICMAGSSFARSPSYARRISWPWSCSLYIHVI